MTTNDSNNNNGKISVVEGAKQSGFEFKRLGSSGLKVSPLVLGCMSYGDPNGNWKWAMPYEQSRPFFQRALELGINFFDTANVYSNGVSEEITGRCLNELAIRDEIVVATKCYFPYGGRGPNQSGLSRKSIFQAVDGSLQRLGMDYIDLLQIHRWDDEVSVEEVMRALHDVVQSGKVRYIGASSMPTWQFARCQWVAEQRGWTKFITMQNHYNLLYREEEREMIPFCKFDGVGLIPWSPLARGLLARPPQAEPTARAETDAFQKYLYGLEADGKVVERVNEIAKKLSVKPAQVALAWHWAKGVDAPIIGATKMEHLEDAVGAVRVKLSGEDVNALEELYQPHPVMGTAVPAVRK